jgi:hypothetical protein
MGAGAIAKGSIYIEVYSKLIIDSVSGEDRIFGIVISTSPGKEYKSTRYRLII